MTGAQRYDQRLTRLSEVLAGGVGVYDLDHANGGDGLSYMGEKYLLVECGAGGDVWITVHNSPTDAAEYHDGQEAADYWSDCTLYDLDSRTYFYPDRKTTFRESLNVDAG